MWQGPLENQISRLRRICPDLGRDRRRAVFYLDITDADVERASELVGEALQHLERQSEESRPAVSAQY